MTVLAYDLDIVDHSDISDGLEAAPRYQRFTDAVKHVIRSIHGIPDLVGDADLDQIEVYLGRAGGTEAHVLGRFGSHRERKAHEHGAILFRGATANVVSWEGWSNRILKGLQERDMLCVANLVAGKNGRIPSTPTSVVYMTWRRIRRQGLFTPTKRDVLEMVKEIVEGASELRPAAQLATAMDPITRPETDFTRLAWHPEHT